MSATSTPASASSDVTEEQAPTLAEVVRKLNTEKLIEFLRGEEHLRLDEDDFDILLDQEITGRAFLKMTKHAFRDCGFSLGSATTLADFTKEGSYSYRTLEDSKEILAKYGIISKSITRIPQFTPATHKIDDDNPAFKFCVEDILRKIKNMGSVVDANEAMRWEYISTILHASVSLLEGLVISPRVGEGPVDYVITKGINERCIIITVSKQHQLTIGICQNLVQCRSACDMNLNMIRKKRKADEAFKADYDYVYGIVSSGTDWYFILHTTDAIYCTSCTEYRISLQKAVLKDDTELRKSVKRVLEVIVGLLKDRAFASDEPTTKKKRVQEEIIGTTVGDQKSPTTP